MPSRNVEMEIQRGREERYEREKVSVANAQKVIHDLLRHVQTEFGDSCDHQTSGAAQVLHRCCKVPQVFL